MKNPTLVDPSGAVLIGDDAELLCRVVAAKRGVNNRDDGALDWITPGIDGKHADHVGARGEYAVSMFTGLPWTGMMSPNNMTLKQWKRTFPCDVGDDIEVRTTLKPAPPYKLLVNVNDPTEFRFVCVDGSDDVLLRIKGWLWGHEAKQKKWWRREGMWKPTYAVPISELHPPETL